MEEACASCRYARPSTKLTELLECRKRPPEVGNRPAAEWPNIYPDGWCGDYEQIEGDPRAVKAARPRAGAKETRPAADATEQR